jgi:hypothetical protein
MTATLRVPVAIAFAFALLLTVVPVAHGESASLDGAPADLLTAVPVGQSLRTPGGNPIRFTARLDGLQSASINSTPVETRTGSGVAVLSVDAVTGELAIELSFQGLIGEDITLGDPDINPDGSIPAPGTVNGNRFDGAGLFLVFLHVGAPGFNGPIAIDIVDAQGVTDGFIAQPNPIVGATAGSIFGKINLFERAMDGMLINGVPLDGRSDDVRDRNCLQCGLIEALLSGNAYVDIWTFNNPFGEIRGQLHADGCPGQLNTLSALRNAVDALSEGSAGRRAVEPLARRLTNVQRALDEGRPRLARELLLRFASDVNARSVPGPLRRETASELLCGATNVAISILAGND